MKFDLYDIEFMAARFKPHPTNDYFLDNRYNWQTQENGAEWPYYRFFHHISRMYQPALIVELGGFQGTCAAHFAAGAKQVITIDHHTDSGDEWNQQKMYEVVKKYININYIQGWTNTELTQSQYGKHQLGDAPNAFPVVQALTRDQKIDILFIDSWHVYEQAKLDYDTYLPLMNEPGLIICDDILEGEKAGNPISGMMRFWNEIKGEKFLNDTLHPGSQMGFVKV